MSFSFFLKFYKIISFNRSKFYLCSCPLAVFISCIEDLDAFLAGGDRVGGAVDVALDAVTHAALTCLRTGGRTWDRIWTGFYYTKVTTGSTLIEEAVLTLEMIKKNL